MTTKYHDHVFLKRRGNVIITVENIFFENRTIHHALNQHKKTAKILLFF